MADKYIAKESNGRYISRNKLRKAIFVLSSVIGSGGLELGRDHYQEIKAGTNNMLWNRHDGFMGLLNDHMGDMWETILAFYVLIGPTNIFCNAFEKMTGKNVNPAMRVLATSIVSALTIGSLEMNSGMSAVSQWQDALIGPLIGLTCLNLSQVVTEQVVDKDGLNKMGRSLIKISEKIGELPNKISDFTKKIK